MGYGGGFQYHCCFFTNYKNYIDYKNYNKRVDELTPKPKEILVNNTEEILDMLKKINPEQLEKAKSYKYKKRATNYLETILK